MLRAILYISLLFDLTVSTNYYGDKVVLLTAKDKTSQKLLGDFIEKKKVDVWQSSSGPNHPCEVRVVRKTYGSLHRFCSERNITLKVVIPNVQKVIDEQRLSNGRSGAHFNYTRYNRYNEIVDEIYNLQNQYPNILRVQKVGFTFEGRRLYIVELSDNVRFSNRKPVVWLESGAHAREWISVATGMYILKKMLKKHGRNGPINDQLRRNRFVFVPVFNPDGYEFSHSENRLWRKTRSLTSFNSSCLGADPNRNWNVKWSEGLGASSDPCNDVYKGIYAESEPCVLTYANLLRSYRHYLHSYWSFHSFFQLLIYPRSYTAEDPKEIKEMKNVGSIFVKAVKKRFGTSYFSERAPNLLGRKISGVSLDFVHDALHVVHSYAVELRDRGRFGFLLPANQIAPGSAEVLDALLASWKYIDSTRRFYRSRAYFDPSK